jgi:hypothetical protein
MTSPDFGDLKDAARFADAVSVVLAVWCVAAAIYQAVMA